MIGSAEALRLALKLIEEFPLFDKEGDRALLSHLCVPQRERELKVRGFGFLGEQQMGNGFSGEQVELNQATDSLQAKRTARQELLKSE